MTKTKPKKISITTFDRIMRDLDVQSKIVEWNGIEIIIKKSLSLNEMLTFTESVVGNCFIEDSGRYLPEIKPFMIRCCVLELYANFKLPDNIEHKYELVYNTDAYETVIKHINAQQFSEILTAIDLRLDNIAQSNIESINSQMNGIVAAFENMNNKFETMFAGVSAEDIEKTMNVLNSKDFDEKFINALTSNDVNSGDK